MDRDYEEIIKLKNEIVKLKEKYVSYKAVLDTLYQERQKYLDELNKMGLDVNNLDEEIKKRTDQINEISNKILKAKEILNKNL